VGPPRVLFSRVQELQGSDDDVNFSPSSLSLISIEHM
jgi:hypothetical protein